jgi:uncharacterized membrane protein
MNAPATAPAKSDRRANLFIAMVVATGAVVLVDNLRLVLAEGLEMRHLAWLALAALTIVVGPLSVRLPLPNCRLSFSDASIFLALLAFGPHLATLTGALDGFAASTRRGGVWYKRAFNTAGMAISVYLSSLVFTRLLPAGRLHGPGLSAVDLVLPVAALVFVQYLVNTALVSTVVALKEHVSPMAIWQDASPWAGTAYLLGSAAAALVFFAIRELGVFLALAAVPFPAILYFTYRACLSRLLKMKRVATV